MLREETKRRTQAGFPGDPVVIGRSVLTFLTVRYLEGLLERLIGQLPRMDGG